MDWGNDAQFVRNRRCSGIWPQEGGYLILTDFVNWMIRFKPASHLLPRQGLLSKHRARQRSRELGYRDTYTHEATHDCPPKIMFYKEASVTLNAKRLEVRLPERAIQRHSGAERIRKPGGIGPFRQRSS